MEKVTPIYIDFFDKTLDASTESSFFKNILRGALKVFIPVANPDFEKSIYLVHRWVIEFNDEFSSPNREIGFDKENNIIVKMPDKNNTGYWTDTEITLSFFRKRFAVSEIQKETFDFYWNSFPSIR